MAKVYEYASRATLEAEATVRGMTRMLLEFLLMPSLKDRYGESVGYVEMSDAQLGVENGGLMARAEVGNRTASILGNFYHGLLRGWVWVWKKRRWGCGTIFLPMVKIQPLRD